jgi:putative lipoic acid-binding regulatory protein
MTENNEQQLQLKYPCAWIYKIIGIDQNDMKSAVLEIIQDRACSIIHSRSSETDKYHCLNVKITVESESHRKIIYEALKAHRAIKMVL